jgi:regulator of cell morphogenesis and NO signaling
VPPSPVELSSAITSERTVADVCRQYPVVVEAFRELGIDLCCGAHLSLAEAAAAAGIPLPALLERVAHAARSATGAVA